VCRLLFEPPQAVLFAVLMIALMKNEIVGWMFGSFDPNIEFKAPSDVLE
jgi:hypothetical protein